MLVMQILNTGRDGINRIYNVKVGLKNAIKVKEATTLKGFSESDIIVNGSSFKNSVFNIKNVENNVVVNFIRNKNYHSDKDNFLITTRSNSNSMLYDLYNVSIPPKKVTVGLDNLYGKVIIDMQKEIPNIKRGRYVSLKDLDVCSHITDDRIRQLKYLVDKTNNEEELKYALIANNLTDLKATVDFVKLFDFKIIGESTINESQITDLLDSLKHTQGKDYRSLNRYYEIAKDNKECYDKLSKINKILYGKSINLIKKEEKSKILVKSSDSRVIKNEKRAA